MTIEVGGQLAACSRSSIVTNFTRFGYSVIKSLFNGDSASLNGEEQLHNSSCLVAVSVTSSFPSSVMECQAKMRIHYWVSSAEWGFVKLNSVF